MSGFQRGMAMLMTVLTVGFGGLWVLGYLYITAMACAFGSVSGRCGTKMPWSHSGEDLLYMVLMPGAIFLVLFAVTTSLWRSKSSSNIET